MTHKGLKGRYAPQALPGSASAVANVSTTTVTSLHFKRYQRAKEDAKDIKDLAAAKEARALAQILRLCPAQRNGLLQTRLDELERILGTKTILATDDPTDLESLSQSRSIRSFCAEFARVWPKRYKILDVIAKSVPGGANYDTRHQDAKDIERDALIVGGGGRSHTVLFGANIGYDGAISAIAVELSEISDCPADSTAVVRFARLLLNAANRTTSGGDAFEAIEKFVKPSHLAFMAPDSTSSLDPLRISCRLGIFKTNAGWDWGIIGRTEAATKYLLFQMEDVDRLNPIARIEGKCIREFGLPLPLPNFNDTRIYTDDGKSIGVREFYECDDGGLLELSGSILNHDVSEMEKALL